MRVQRGKTFAVAAEQSRFIRKTVCVCVCACPSSQTENLFEGRVVQIQQSHQELGKGPSFLLFVSFLFSPLFASRRACMGIGMDEIARAPHSSTCCIMKFT